MSSAPIGHVASRTYIESLKLWQPVKPYIPHVQFQSRPKRQPLNKKWSQPEPPCNIPITSLVLWYNHPSTVWFKFHVVILLTRFEDLKLDFTTNAGACNVWGATEIYDWLLDPKWSMIWASSHSPRNEAFRDGPYWSPLRSLGLSLILSRVKQFSRYFMLAISHDIVSVIRTITASESGEKHKYRPDTTLRCLAWLSHSVTAHVRIPTSSSNLLTKIIRKFVSDMPDLIALKHNLCQRSRLALESLVPGRETQNAERLIVNTQ